MGDLKIIKAKYFDPGLGVEQGTDVTDELSAQIIDNRLLYNGIYNKIFPDHFEGKHKRLRVDIEYRNKKFTRFYNENEKINLPYDLGEVPNRQILDERNPSNVFGDYVAGDKIGRDKKVNTASSDWLKKYWWRLLIPVLVAVAAYVINEGRLPGFINIFTSSKEEQTEKPIIATTTPNLADIFSKTNSMMFDLEKENFLKDFKNEPVYAVGAVFSNINTSGDGFMVRMTVERNIIGCAFSSDIEKELLSLKKGDKVNFYGIFTGGGLAGYGAANPWYITDCILLK